MTFVLLRKYRKIYLVLFILVLTTKGQFTILSNYPEELEFFFLEKLYENYIYFSHPRLYRSGYVFTPITSNREYQDLIHHR